MPSWGGDGQVPSRVPLSPQPGPLASNLGEPPLLAHFQPIPWAPSGVQLLRKRLPEKTGPLPTHQSLHPCREQGRLRPGRSFPIPQSLTFHPGSACPGFSPASFQEEIRPPPFIRTLLPSSRHHPPPCFSCQLLDGKAKSREHHVRLGWGSEAGVGRTVAGVGEWGSGTRRQAQGWGGVDTPENPGIGRESWSSPPALSRGRSQPRPHLTPGPVRLWEGLLHRDEEVRGGGGELGAGWGRSG